MSETAIPLAVSFAYLSLVSFSVCVFLYGLSFRGRVSALIAAQIVLGLHFLFLKWESLHWLTWPFAFPSWCLASLWTLLPSHEPDPNLTFDQALDRIGRVFWTCTLFGFVCNAVVLGVAAGFVSDVVRRRRRRRAERNPPTPPDPL